MTLEQLAGYFGVFVFVCGMVANVLPQRWAVTKGLTRIGALTLRATTKHPPISGVVLALFAFGALQLTGCAGTFEESSGKLTLATPRKAADPVLCQQLSSRARWEKALAATGAALTGASGIATWPIRSEDGKTGLAIASGVLAGGTVLVLALWEADAASYIEAGCAAPKEPIK